MICDVLITSAVVSTLQNGMPKFDQAKPQDLFDLLVFSFPAVANPARQIRHYAIASGQMASTSLTFFECASTFAT